MIQDLFDWLKTTGAHIQVDFGNLAVGLATALITVSLFVALRSTRALNHHKIAGFRQVWIEDLRLHIAQHYELCALVAFSTTSETDMNRKRGLFDERFSRLAYLETYIRLKLNPAEALHIDLMDRLIKMRLCLSHLDGEKTNKRRKHIIDEFHQLRRECINISKRVLNLEWDRLKDEIHGRGRLNRAFPNFVRQRRTAIDWQPVHVDWRPAQSELNKESK